MIEIHPLNCVKIVSPINDDVSGHCMLLKENDKLMLIDSGIGLLDTLNPIEITGQELIDIAGYRFEENQTAFRKIENLGFDPTKVTDSIIGICGNVVRH